MKAKKKLDHQTIKEGLIAVIKPYMTVEFDLNAITETTDLRTDLKINSINFVDIILDMESKFEVTIDDNTADAILTVGDAINAVLKGKEAKG